MSCRSKNVDRLSLLPDELLSHILSLMPTESAVRTSSLSKRWRNTWTLSANLDFYFYRRFHINYVSMIVNGALNLCKTSQLKLFRLGFDYCISVPNSVLLRWINEAVRLKVCELDLEVSPIELPLSVFTCSTLTNLRIAENYPSDRKVFNVPSNVKLPCLKTLEIHDYTKPTVSALRLIHGCPVLESLSLRIVSGYYEEEYNFNIPTLKRLILTIRRHSDFLNKVVLNVPSLESFSFDGGLSLLFVMEDLSSLVEATFDIDFVSSNHLMAELLKGISGVKSLSWFTSNLYVFSNAPLPKFPNLKHLDFQSSICTRWLQVIQILEWFPELEHLCIQGAALSGWIKPQLVPRCMVSNLKTMNITVCGGRKCDIEFLEYMLVDAEVLKKLTLKCYVNDEMRLCAQLLKLPRASRYCEIHFVDWKNG